jgi:uncharacterized membrane protein YhaH (DUF805 family)
MEVTEDLSPAPPSRRDDSPVPRYLSLSQRIGRVRYFVYSIGGSLFVSAVLLLIYLLCLTLPPSVALVIYNVSAILITKIAIPLIVFVMTIRRLHDIDFKGWWALLAIVPFLTVVLLFVPGTQGNNRFGPPPRANSVAVRLAAILLPLGMFLLFFGLKDAPTHQESAARAAEAQLKRYPQ